REGENASDDPDFEYLFRNMWADNADVVSKSYSGTGALKTDFTRTGQRTKMGIWSDIRNSVTRYFLNNFADGWRQDAFDVFLGAYKPADKDLLGSIFVDRRPLVIQAIPYVLAACIFLIFIGSFTRRDEEAGSVWPLRLLMVLSLVMAGVCLRFIWNHGKLYVRILLFPPLSFPLEYDI